MPTDGSTAKPQCIDRMRAAPTRRGCVCCLQPNSHTVEVRHDFGGHVRTMSGNEVFVVHLKESYRPQ
jgi:hypothetical protein